VTLEAIRAVTGASLIVRGEVPEMTLA